MAAASRTPNGCALRKRRERRGGLFIEGSEVAIWVTIPRVATRSWRGGTERFSKSNAEYERLP
jgi:hypothetical protein